MLFTSLETAQRLEEADVLHLSRQNEACAQLFPDHKSFTVPIGNGVAAITLPSLGRKLNRITGYGVGTSVSEKDLVIVEDLFTRNGVDTEIILCSLADPSALKVLASREYIANGFLNNYARVLTDEDLEEVNVEGVTISRITAERAQEFPPCCAAGYRDTGRAELFETVARAAILRPDTRLYIASVDGKVAGSSAMALIETSRGGVANLYIFSTLPDFRGRGIQAALLKAGLADARKAGYELASIGARPGNGGSCRNIERAGFSLAYTKTWCSKARKH
ncbi:hypothetical protein N431DRAFT_436268 [Stipitochalara longipes BDJ]|nr:hypothetical protein N431DRAFT_436268 [Stipitochalara longipes BDJ]